MTDRQDASEGTGWKWMQVRSSWKSHEERVMGGYHDGVTAESVEHQRGIMETVGQGLVGPCVRPCVGPCLIAALVPLLCAYWVCPNGPQAIHQTWYFACHTLEGCCVQEQLCMALSKDCFLELWLKWLDWDTVGYKQLLMQYSFLSDMQSSVIRD